MLLLLLLLLLLLRAILCQRPAVVCFMCLSAAAAC
jgi:hypothetical protein